MARKSRKPSRISTAGTPEQERIKTPAVLYLRLSKADADTGRDSMTGQEQLLRSCLKNYDDLEIVSVFTDDGFTGTNFHRPAYEEMMDGVRDGIYKCIVVKDLSRLGRSYLETSDLLEYELPLYGCRFISVNDSIDTKFSPIDTILVGLKNIMNQKYAEDISRKIKATFKGRKENGEYLGGPTPYGYLRDPENRGRFIIDEIASSVIRRIYDMKLQRMTDVEIASILTEEGVLCPRDYMSFRKTGKKPEPLIGWKWDAIRRITTSQLYLGCTVHDKLKPKRYVGEADHKKRQSEWTVYEGINPPIITEEMFKAVKIARRKNSGTR